MRWVLWTPQIIETADGMSKEQLVEQLVAQRILRGAADVFELYPVADAECYAPNGAAGEEQKEHDATQTSAEK